MKKEDDGAVPLSLPLPPIAAATVARPRRPPQMMLVFSRFSPKKVPLEVTTDSVVVEVFTLRLVGQKPVPRCELRCFFNSLSLVPLTFPAYSIAWNSVAGIGIGLMTGTRCVSHAARKESL